VNVLSMVGIPASYQHKHLIPFNFSALVLSRMSFRTARNLQLVGRCNRSRCALQWKG
jgi:hypothetical protein